ncbi:MAG TPA: hypothetical protein VND22_01745 [Actinomycetota bacterium]|nr:hypothetical protein [Actinomycetota bacterium]
MQVVSGSRFRGLGAVALSFVLIAAVLYVVAGLSVDLMPHATPEFEQIPHAFPEEPWLEGWVRWDAGWYWTIAEQGYTFTPGKQSPVVFFPAYPLAMKALAIVTGNVYLAGIIITFLSGMACALLLFLWCRQRMTQRESLWAAALLVAYPFSFYLFGAVYSDALFVAAVIGAFLLLDHDHPLMAGVVAAIATAARPVGVALIIGLVIRAIERRDALSKTRPWIRWQNLRPADGGVLLSAGGLAGFAIYLWVKFGSPFVFLSAASAPGWDLDPGPATWFKKEFFRVVLDLPLSMQHLRLGSYALITLGALALVPKVLRRFGWGYAVYAFAVVAMPALSSKDFVGMARYVIAAFPCFAVAGGWLSSRRRVGIPLLTISVFLLLVMTSLFARRFYIS